MKFKLRFRRPQMVSRGSHSDKIRVEVINPSIFVSKQTNKPLKFDAEALKAITKSIPVLIESDVKQRIGSVTETGNVLVTTLSSGNFLIWLTLGGSLQVLWGLIRSMRFLILAVLIEVPLSGPSQQFFDGCATVAQLDMFDGK